MSPRERERQHLLARAKAGLAEITQIHRDCEHWNRVNPTERPLIADPTGTLRRAQQAYERVIALLEGEAPDA